MRTTAVVRRMDAVVDDFARRARFFQEPLTPGRARTFVRQHRLNTRQRNSVLKLRVATNCPVWDLRLRIIAACAQEVIADHAHGGGRPHWRILEELGTFVGMRLADIRAARPLPSTQLCWLAWDALMTSRHWLEGLVANTCAERVNVPGYGTGAVRRAGWFGMERERWAALFGLPDEKLEFFELHTEADIEHSNLGWTAVARYAAELGMEDAVVEACRVNLLVWEQYLDGIAEDGDREDRARPATRRRRAAAGSRA
ncbi:MAG: iron-containing redox enzyme family protein [Candidatus Rokuibacteriota bacterium]